MMGLTSLEVHNNFFKYNWRRKYIRTLWIPWLGSLETHPKGDKISVVDLTDEIVIRPLAFWIFYKWIYNKEQKDRLTLKPKKLR